MSIIFHLLRHNIIMKKLLLLLLITLCLFCGCKNEINNSSSVEKKVEKVVYLTFDDGPSLVTSSVLNVLDEYNVKATFFVVGKCVQAHPNILKQIYNSGHSIGLHSYCHEYKKIYYDENSFKQDLIECYNAVKKVIPDYNGRIFRFAGGSFNLRQEFKDLVLSLGYTYYDWNASTLDAEGIIYSPSELCENAVKTSKNKNKVILLAHDGGGKDNTAKALPYIIEYYKNAGFTFKTL